MQECNDAMEVLSKVVVVVHAWTGRKDLKMQMPRTPPRKCENTEHWRKGQVVANGDGEKVEMTRTTCHIPGRLAEAKGNEVEGHAAGWL